jgi:succinoglycan biosynthesis transport protein ExoP
MDSTNIGPYIEDEIDLRKYIFILFRHWWLIGLAGLLAALAALVVSFIMVPTYETTALVAITGARYEFEFNPLDESESSARLGIPPYKAMLALATTDDLLIIVMADLKDNLPSEVEDLEDFRGMVEAKASSDPSVLEFIGSARSPELAAQISNTWASRYVSYVNDIYLPKSDDQVFFTTQVEEARLELKSKEDALVDFQARNEAAVLQARLNARENLLNSYHGTQNSLIIIKRNVRALRIQLEALHPDSQVSLGDDLAALGLQIQALNAYGAPIEVQLGEEPSLSRRTAGELANYLTDLENTIEEELTDLEMEIASLPDEILQLQKQIQEVTTEENRLITNVDLAREAFLSLSRKLEETQILSQSTEGDARLASTAAPPIKPVSPRKLFNTAVAGVLGLMIGVFGVFFKEYMFPKEDGEEEKENQS